MGLEALLFYDLGAGPIDFHLLRLVSIRFAIRSHYHVKSVGKEGNANSSWS
jgi:hypothetical protein